MVHDKSASKRCRRRSQDKSAGGLVMQVAGLSAVAPLRSSKAGSRGIQPHSRPNARGCDPASSRAIATGRPRRIAPVSPVCKAHCGHRQAHADGACCDTGLDVGGAVAFVVISVPGAVPFGEQVAIRPVHKSVHAL